MSIGFSRIDIVGEKIQLRPIKASDAKTAYPLITDDRVLSRLAGEWPTGEEDLHDRYRQWAAEIKTGASYSLAIECVDQPGLIGYVGIHLPRHPKQADLGYWLGFPFWNKGYMTEAIRLVCHFCFKYLDVVRVYATAFVGNVGSRRVLEKNGFSLDGTLRSHIFKRNEWRDGWFLTLLRPEWEGRRQQFCPRHEDVVVARSEE